LFGAAEPEHRQQEVDGHVRTRGLRLRVGLLGFRHRTRRLRGVALLRRQARLPKGNYRSRRQAQSDRHGNTQRQCVAPREAAHAIRAAGQLARLNRTVRERIIQVAQQVLDVRVAVVRRFREGLQRDGVEIGDQRAWQIRRGAGRARPLRQVLGDPLHAVGDGQVVEIERRPSRDEEIEQGAQAVDVGCARWPCR
jgi:hypothetical protein